jgi:hypothetical protein
MMGCTQMFQHFRSRLRNALPVGAANYIWPGGRLKRRVNSGKAPQESSPCLLIQTFGISLFTNSKRSINEDLDKVREYGPDNLPQRFKRADDRNQDNSSLLGHEFRYVSDPANVLHPVAHFETEIGAQTPAKDISIQNPYRMAIPAELFSKRPT